MNKTPKTPKERPPILRTIKLVGFVTLALIGLLAVAVVTMPGCGTKPAPIATPVQPQPDDHAPPPPDVGECVAKIESMQGAVSIATISAALLVSKNSKYGPAVKVALAALDAALANAKVQCGSGNVDGWQVALAAFDAAFEQLSEAGDELSAHDAEDGPPPYRFSLDHLNYRVFEETE